MNNYPDDFNDAAFDRAWGGLTEQQEAEFAYELGQMDAARALYRDILTAVVTRYRRHGVAADRRRFEQWAEQVAEMVEDDVYTSYRTLRDNDIDVTPVGDPKVLAEILGESRQQASAEKAVKDMLDIVTGGDVRLRNLMVNPATYDQLGKDI